jgi:predicted transcriptional regulator
LTATQSEKRVELFLQAALAAWNAYQATGMRGTADEVDAWLTALEMGNDAPPPECHG